MSNTCAPAMASYPICPISTDSSSASEARADAAVKFAVRVAEARGGVSEQEVEALKAAGFDDGELLEIVSHVAANTFTNYMNEVFKTDVDFPKVDREAA